MDMSIFVPANPNVVNAASMIEYMDQLWEKDEIKGKVIKMQVDEHTAELLLDAEVFQTIYNALLEIRNKG